MPHYFFNFCIDGRNSEDATEVELETEEQAKKNALLSIKEALTFDEDEGDERRISCSVSDRDGKIIYTVHLSVESSVK